MNISGVLVYTPADKSEQVSQMLSDIDGVEIHANSNGKLVVTIEAKSAGLLADHVTEFQNMPHVLSAAVIYHHDENDFDEIIDPATFPTCGCNEINPQEAIQ